MANITLQDLISSNITGASLFNDSESFMQDLSEDELNLQGGSKKHQRTGRDIDIFFPKPHPRPTPPIFRLP
jgi:hypothetical protein